MHIIWFQVRCTIVLYMLPSITRSTILLVSKTHDTSSCGFTLECISYAGHGPINMLKVVKSSEFLPERESSDSVRCRFCFSPKTATDRRPRNRWMWISNAPTHCAQSRWAADWSNDVSRWRVFSTFITLTMIHYYITITFFIFVLNFLYTLVLNERRPLDGWSRGKYGMIRVTTQ